MRIHVHVVDEIRELTQLKWDRLAIGQAVGLPAELVRLVQKIDGHAEHLRLRETCDIPETLQKRLAMRWAVRPRTTDRRRASRSERRGCG